MKEKFGIEFITVKEAADLLQVSANTIKQRCKAGILPAFRSGKIIRIAKSDMEAYLERCQLVAEGRP